MSKQQMAFALVMMVAAGALGAFLAGQVVPAFAQEPPPATTTKPAPGSVQSPGDLGAVTQKPPIVAAMPYATRTEYEQDPFETTRLRRTESRVEKLIMVRADGTMEVKECP